jgi:hypothetical protein
MPVDDQTVGGVIEGNAYRNPIPIDDPYFVTLHGPGQLSRDDASILQGNDIVPPTRGFGNAPLNMDQIVLGQYFFSLYPSAGQKKQKYPLLPEEK